MRKAIAIIIAILAIGGSAMAINSAAFSGKSTATTTTATRVAQPQAENLIDIATAEATEAPVVTPAPAATPVVTAEPVVTPVPVATPVVTAEPTAQAMSFMAWLAAAQNTETGALNGTFDEECVTRINFIEGEVVNGYASFEVAGRYFSVVVEGYEFTGSKSADEATFVACNKHEGQYFDWTTRFNGDLVRYELTSEFVEELKKVAVCWQDEAGNTVYGILLCSHNGGSRATTSSNAGNGGNGGNGGEQPSVTPTPSQAPTASPAPLPSPDPTEVPVTGPEDPIVTQPPVENEPEYSDTEETTVPENEDPIIVGTPVDNTPTYNDESATAGKQESTSQQAAPLMAAPLMEVESAPAQEQTVQAADDPIVVTEPVQEANEQEMAPLMPAPLAAPAE